ncbi:hypothetical protein [Virgisporangium aurantiacum]|uniref:hypothetical protein n=1 Tax=Virgisporangium aurantiacum TaxID=175570 RepID=UPI001950CDAE|nr:hypothetical protein [Virgisporangium aurantiacum]
MDDDRTVGYVITGTRGSGKTTVAQMLTRGSGSIGRVPSVTTRPPRPDDRRDTYFHLAEHEFDALAADGRLILVGTYGAARYGIVADSIDAELRAGRRPLLTVSPDAAAALVAGARPVRWRGAFLDARDDLLDGRLRAAGRAARAQDRRQRVADRAFAGPPLTVVRNDGPLSDAVRRVRRLFDLADAGSSPGQLH